jgi:hypothetical protein
VILQAELEAIDREVTKAALQAERSPATRTFGYAWSPTLAESLFGGTVYKRLSTTRLPGLL